jgi:hypothetical protein
MMISVVPVDYADYMKHADAKVDRRPPKYRRPKKVRR